MDASTHLNLVFGALSDPTRRGILGQLTHGPLNARELAKPFPISWPAISQHLNVLERAGLIKRTAQAQWRVVSLRSEALIEAAAWIDAHRQDWEERFDLLEERLAKTDPGQGDA